MKSIALKVVEYSIDDNKAKFDYRQQLISILRSPMQPGAGMDFEEVRKAVGMLQKIHDAKDKVELNDEEAKYVSERVKAVRWQLADQVVVDFVSAVTQPGTAYAVK
jgi:hypothetical protein